VRELDLFKFFFERYLGPGSFAYTIFKPCHRCVYGKRNEPIIIVSGKTGLVKIVVNFKGRTYARRGDCHGWAKCNSCLKAIEEELDLPCKWLKI